MAIKMNCAQESDKGFTLMEILVVVSIVAILSTLGILNYKNVIDRSKRAAVLDEIREYGMQSGIARGDTGIFWRLQDLQSGTMPVADVYGRPVFASLGGLINADTSLWKGPYISLQKTTGTDNKKKFDDQGYPIDLYGDRYKVALLRIQGNSTTLMNDPNESPANRPDDAIIISWGPDRTPGSSKNTSVSYDQKTANYWLYFDEPESDDIFYFF